MINNETINRAFARTKQVLSDYKGKTIICSVSGGADSDVMLDMIEKVSPHTVQYIWLNTGIEYQATKDHLQYLENKYGIEIKRINAKIPVPLGNKKYGQPFLSKQVSEYISRLQRHNFKWEDRPFDELYDEYPNCKIALGWWCNSRGENSHFNIEYNVWLKEYLISNPPTFSISNKCCEGAKKRPFYDYAKTERADLVITGVRKAEGGARATAYKEDLGAAHNFMQFRPILYFTDADKVEYEEHFGIQHSKCYTEYGLKRTGCVGCPFGRDCESEFDVVQRFEPRLYKAICNIFGESREYTRKYQEFKRIMSLKANKNKKCFNCGSIITGDDTIPMNLKFYGRDIKKFYCKDCFMRSNDMTDKDWNNAVDGFKAQGCELF